MKQPSAAKSRASLVPAPAWLSALALAVVLPLASVPVSSAAGPGSSITLEAVSANAGNARNYNWQSDYGDYQFTSASFKVLGVTIRNLGPMPTTVRLEWFFFGTANGSIPRVIFDGGQQETTVPARQEQRLGLQSVDVQQVVTQYAGLGERRVEGLEVSGWMVRVLADQTVVGVVGSSVALEEMGKSTASVCEALAFSRRLLGEDLLPALYPPRPRQD